MRLSVVLGTLNRLEHLKRCINSILGQTTTPTVVYVTDAGSTDGTTEYLKSIASDVVVPILVGKKLGQAKAYNDVFRAVNTPYVAWLSDDNEVVNGGLDIGVRILDRRPKVGMVSLKVRDVQGPFIAAPYIGGISECGVLNVNQGMLRTDVLKEAGYFSETFGFYGIDPDLTAMVLYRGHHITFTKEVAIHHYRDWALDKSTAAGAALAAHHEKSKLLYRAKYGGIGENDQVWLRKKAAWNWIKTKLGGRYQPNSGKRFLGGVPRDWNNAWLGRHISPLDPILTAGAEHHLVQRAGPWSRPATLPQDPSPETVKALLGN